MRRRRRACLLLMASLLSAPGAGLAASQAAETRPAEQLPSPEAIAEAVRQLGHPRYHVREKATQFLWRAGRAAESALRKALNSADPEVTARAESILEKFRYGIFPDTPAEVLALILQYRAGNVSVKRNALSKLIAMGGSGCETALALIQTERRGGVRSGLEDVVALAAGKLAAALVIDGKHARAERTLELAAQLDTRSHARDLAAYVCLRGRLAPTIRRYAAQRPLEAVEARVLAYLYRAQGDLAASAEVAAKANDPWLYESILSEKGDWGALARLQAKRAATRGGDIEVLGYLAAYHRLAGNEKDLAAALAAIQAWAQAGGPTSRAWFAAEAMLLNDRPDEAIELLIRQKLPRSAADFLELRDQFERALTLLSAEPGEEKERSETAVRRTKLLWRMGRQEEARRILSDLAASTGKALAAGERDTDVRQRATALTQMTSILRAQRDLGLKADARRGLLAALPQATSDSRRQALLEGVYGASRSEQALVWWTVLGKVGPQDSVADRLKRLDAILDGRTPVATLRTWVQEVLRGPAAPAGKPDPNAPARTRTDAARLKELEDLRRRLRVIADTCADRGEVDLAIRCAERAVELAPSSAAWVQAGDLHLRKKNWAKAGGCYENAWELDHGNVSALFLWAWALHQAGRRDRARELMDLARLLPLGDGQKRYELMQTMARLGQAEAARKEADCLIRTASMDSRERRRCLRARAQDAAHRSQEVALREQTRLICLRTSAAFIEPRYYLISAAQVHLARARAHAARGEVAQALAEGEVCRRIMPSYIDAAIELAGELDERGRQAEAERVFRPFFDHARALCRKYPKGAQLHNRTAWLAARCKRELAAALAHAERAVALAPDRDAFLDTLAEVHFVRGDRKRAIQLMRKCLEMSPGQEWYQKQLKRFGGEGAATRPGG